MNGVENGGDDVERDQSTFILFQDKAITQKSEKLVKQHHLVNLSFKDRQSL